MHSSKVMVYSYQEMSEPHVDFGQDPQVGSECSPRSVVHWKKTNKCTLVTFFFFMFTSCTYGALQRLGPLVYVTSPLLQARGRRVETGVSLGGGNFRV